MFKYTTRKDYVDFVKKLPMSAICKESSNIYDTKIYSWYVDGKLVAEYRCFEIDEIYASKSESFYILENYRC